MAPRSARCYEQPFMLSLICALALHSTPVPAVHLLPVVDDESFVGLGAEQLIERRRLLIEERPSIGLPLLTLIGGGFFFVAGPTFGGLAADKTFGHDAEDPGLGVGIALGVIGLCAVVAGAIWLVHELSVRSKVNARIEEIDSLIELKTHPPQTSLEVSPGGVALRF